LIQIFLNFYIYYSNNNNNTIAGANKESIKNKKSVYESKDEDNIKFDNIIDELKTHYNNLYYYKTINSDLVKLKTSKLPPSLHKNLHKFYSYSLIILIKKIITDIDNNKNNIYNNIYNKLKTLVENKYPKLK
jgi:hypothetical protein